MPPPLRYTASTIGASFLVKELNIGAQKITLQIWDTAGQERFRSMAPLYYRGAVAAILVFSLNDASSFEKLKDWVRELTSNVEEPLVLALAANKCDLTDRAVPAEALATYADSIGALLFETSAKTNLGVRERSGTASPMAPAGSGYGCHLHLTGPMSPCPHSNVLTPIRCSHPSSVLHETDQRTLPRGCQTPVACPAATERSVHSAAASNAGSSGTEARGQMLLTARYGNVAAGWARADGGAS